jgi:hypothetical protein
MMNAINSLAVFNRLVNAYPFIYRTKTLGTKFIGFAVFGKCTPIEEKKYEEYCSKLKSVSDFEHYEELKEYDELIDAFENVAKCEPELHDCVGIGEISFKLRNELAALPPSELEEIDLQYKDFLKVRSLSVRREIKKWTDDNQNQK